jgi:peptidoglycan DL-endopeptidase CwlO
MTDMTATLARVAGIAGTLRSLSGAVPTTAASRTSASTASTASSTATSTGASGIDFASALQGAVASDAATALGTSGSVAVPSVDLPTSSAGDPADAVDGGSVVADARRYLGVKYRWGGSDPATGLDCSGLTQRVFADLGVKLPRTVAQQQHVGSAVPSMDQARPGDLLVFGTHHIGIYVGDGKMLHAPHSGDVVKIAKVYETPTKIRRVVGAGEGAGSVSGGTSASDVRPTALRSGGSASYDSLFAAATRRYDLPAGLLKSVARAESGFNPRAHSAAGAIGLMQLMPGTARELGVDPHDPAEAVDGAARLLRSHLDQFGAVRLAVAAYNAGPGAVRRYDGVPPYAETRTYVQRVLAGMKAVAA